jgi:hypothetical protein
MTIVDAGQNPEAKALFLSGQVNIAVCPQCGHAGMLSTPLVYHDPEKELLFTHVPAELGLPEMEQQRIVGDLTNAVMSSLPTEQRKGYLLRPRSFLSLESMIEAILEADGITPEMLEAQRTKAALLERLLNTPSEDARQIIIQENDEHIDYEFFQILSLNIEMAQAREEEPVAQQLLALREQLLTSTTAGREAAARQEAIRELESGLTREELLDKLVAATLADEQTKVETMVLVARPAIDYAFYQQLTERIKVANQSGSAQEAETLRTLRETILELTARIDAEMQQAAEDAGQLLQEILQSDDPEKTILAHLDQVDELFLNVLTSNLDTAVKSGQTQLAERLREISDIVMKLIEESQPPEVQLISKLLSAEYPAGTQALLDENRQQVNSQLLEIMQLIEQDLSRNGQVEAAQRLAQIRELAATLI